LDADRTQASAIDTVIQTKTQYSSVLPDVRVYGTDSAENIANFVMH